MSAKNKLVVTVEVITPENSTAKVFRDEYNAEEEARLAVNANKLLAPDEHKRVADAVSRWIDSVDLVFVPR
jgi:UDP-N-acetylglucosamine:LPS N-acetylglucosamine transferase|uniref:Uncharacterized protein n=1 Tax=viral metagenome TaxID=1070528 RepID=A0A6C0AHH5_9ZZZZ